jgi:hypothetical protein
VTVPVLLDLLLCHSRAWLPAVSVWLLELKWRTPWLSGHCTTVKGGVVRAQGTD